MIEKLKKQIPMPVKQGLKMVLYRLNQITYRKYILSTIRNQDSKRKLKIAIFMLFAENWNSYVSIYNEIKRHKEIDLTVYVLPRIEFGKPNMTIYNSTIKFFEDEKIDFIRGYDEEAKTWLDTSKFEYDYIFYSLPYRQNYIREFSPSEMFKKSKICYVPYGFILTKSKNLLRTVLNLDFIQYMYVFFASWDLVANYVVSQYRIIGAKFHYVEKLGFPRFDLGFPARTIDDKYKTILWLPRFVIDGIDPSERTSFFDFYQKILDRIQGEKDEYWTIRPHPLAFQNYIEKGMLTKTDVERYIRKLNDEENSRLDDNKDYRFSFGESDILVSDFSSLIIEFFMTGKPIIYCGSKAAIPIDELLGCMYCTGSWEETVSYVNLLKRGLDPLKEKRDRLIEKLYPEKNCGKRIVEFILDDFKRGL